MNIKLETYDLPEQWACAFMYGDNTGLTDKELEAVHAITVAMIKEHGACNCVDVADTQGGDFRRWHDASDVFPFACNVAQFTFDVGV